MRSAYICHPLRGRTGSPEEIKSNLERIDELWVLGEWRESKGCLMEIEYAKRLGKGVEFKG